MNALRSTTAEELLKKELERLHQQAVDALSPHNEQGQVNIFTSKIWWMQRSGTGHG